MRIYKCVRCLARMERFSDAARRFAAADRVLPDPPKPLFVRTAQDHARIIAGSCTITAIDAGLALIARRSNAALGIIKTAAVRYDHPGLAADTSRWIVTVMSSDDAFDVLMVCLESGEERSVRFASTDGDGIAREPERGLDLARALLERDLQAKASGLVLADGSISARFPEERRACAALPETVLGVVKRASIARSNAPEAIAARCSEPLFALYLDGAWYSRLHPLSARIIRVEGALTAERFDALLIASSDAAIPGYPYALILADRFARISNREARSLSLESAARFGLDIGSLHDVLDSLER
jgi:(2Fe-2S) ferredoxin